jgi:hypothetical protein
MRTVLAALLILGWVPAPLLADTPTSEHELCMQATQCRTASDAELDELRGGFDVDTPRGRLRLEIGITRAVSVNDRIVAVSNFVIPGSGRTTQSSQTVVNNVPVGSGVPLTVNGNALVVQNGPGNVAPSPSAFSAAAFPIIVQNTLDNQKLSTFTLINASVNSLSVMNALRMSEMLRRATAASGR